MLSRSLRPIRIIKALILLCAVLQANIGWGSETPKNLKCEVAIIGGGPGGLYSAYRLGPKLDKRVCVFERENHLGGRLYDEPLVPGGPVHGVGGLRVMEGQDLVFALANELGITLEPGPYVDDMISTRGVFAFDTETLRKEVYPLVSESEAALYNKLQFGPERANVASYPDYRSYVRSVVGEEQYFFLRDILRFRGDYTYPLDARGYLDWLDEETNVCCTGYFPVGGMSQFPLRMADRARQNGVRIFTSEPAISINGRGGHYFITTPTYRVKATRLIIAADPTGFKAVTGNIARRIQAQAQFQHLTGVKVATVTQWFPRSWWNNLVEGRDVHRAWTTEACLNAIEIPKDKYDADQLVVRTVYSDDRDCVDFWEITARENGIEAVEAEINRGLKYLFPKADIPKPLKTVVQIWPAGWYFLGAGSDFTNASIAAWAVRPLPGEAVSLVGDAYHPQRATWSDGAYKSAINALNASYGFDIKYTRSGMSSGPTIKASRLNSLPARH
ncbi:MAG: hypothetical protein EBT06_12275 [Gammaproteobacteria bacterium]|nr:hypothetical protein [Gammaproteobacteria bacterium]NBT45663.1 hypothetical protein [Gammaproteobacteria bacterium]NBY21918.1 hypothetical protein [Gammaproteobacteria bacterium]